MTEKDKFEGQFNIEAEQYLLGAIITNNEVINQVGSFLKAEHFYEPIHKTIYSAMQKLTDRGVSATFVSINSMLVNDPRFIEVGGRQYLANLAVMSVTPVNSYNLAQTIYDYFCKRSMMDLADDLKKVTFYSSADQKASEILQDFEAKIFKLSEMGESENKKISLGDSIKNSLSTIAKAIKNKKEITGVGSGFIDLDKKLFGFQRSDLIILAARPSMGKTALALNLAYNAAKHFIKEKEDKSVGFFSLEMSSEQLSSRLLSKVSKINSGLLKTGKLNESQYSKLRHDAQILSDLKFNIDDTGGLTMSALRTKARRMKRKDNLGILFIDYLQLIRGNRSKENKVQEITEISNDLKALAKELDIPIIALSQLSRKVEDRTDKLPVLSDLRESGSIEQDADIVMFIHREEYYLSRKEPTEHNSLAHAEWMEKMSKIHNQADIIIAKHRAGSVGNVQLFFDAEYGEFKDLFKN